MRFPSFIPHSPSPSLRTCISFCAYIGRYMSNVRMAAIVTWHYTPMGIKHISTHNYTPEHTPFSLLSVSLSLLHLLLTPARAFSFSLG